MADSLTPPPTDSSTVHETAGTLETVAESPRDHYRLGESEARKQVAGLERRVTRVARLRVLAFFAMVGPFLLLETSARERWPLLIALGSAGLIAFLALLRFHGHLKRQRSRAELRVTLSLEAQARLDRRWDDLPPPPLQAAPDDHPSAGDLDLVGRASLSHLIGRVSTAPGRSVLRQLILDPFAPLPAHGGDLIRGVRAGQGVLTTEPPVGWMKALVERQEAVSSLSKEGAFRERFELLAREIEGGGAAHGTERFLEWLEQPRWLPDHGPFLLLARFLGLLTPAAVVAWLFGWIPGLFPALGAVGALWLHRKVGGEASDRLESAEAGNGDLAGWSALFALIEEGPVGSPGLERLRMSAVAPAPGARRALRALARITDTASVRSSSLLHFPLVTLFAWDVHMLRWLEQWHAKHAEAAGQWIRSLGEMEALCAFGGLCYDHPEWSFAEFSGDARAGVRARELGHPLLNQEVCLPNDVQVPPPGGMLLVTGSNMAGKTTLLRAIGANQVLALAGGPVAARELETLPILPWTAMRVRDSLDEGVSYFLAELHRLKRVVDAARSGPMLYLLDEILQGTNSAERKMAAQIVLEQLLESDAMGAITTHDLSLASSDELRKKAVQVHFREEVRDAGERRELHFDYKLRSGPATSRNALLLLEIVGLGRPTRGGSSEG